MASTSKSKENDNNQHNLENTDLPPLFAFSIACILEETIDKLLILSNISGLPHVKQRTEIGKIEDKININEDDITLLEEQIFPKQHNNCDEIVKFQKDTNFIRNVLEETYQSLINAQNFESLVKHVKEYQTLRSKEKNILDKAENCHKQLEILKKTSEIETKENQLLLQEKTEEIGRVKDEIENIIMENEMKLEYFQKWKKSKEELNSFTINRYEDERIENISKLNTDIQRENRINSEIESYFVFAQKEYEKKITEWTERYETEIKKLDLDIKIIKNKIEDQHIRFSKMKNTYEEHKLFIESWQEHKKRKFLEIEKEKTRNQAAIKIQSWWRGTMVRKKLGSYGKRKSKSK